MQVLPKTALTDAAPIIADGSTGRTSLTSALLPQLLIILQHVHDESCVCNLFLLPAY